MAIRIVGPGGVPMSRTLTMTSPLTIDGGASADLSADRTIAIAPGAVGEVLTTIAGPTVAWATSSGDMTQGKVLATRRGWDLP